MRRFRGAKSVMRRICAGALALGMIGATTSAMAASPAIVPVQGHLADANGVAVEGAHDLTFKLFDGATGGTLLYEEQRAGVPLEHGDFVVYLGDEESADAGAAGPALEMFRDRGELWLELTIDGTEVISPRFRLATVPYAGYAPYCGPNNSIDNGAMQALVGGNVGIKQAADPNVALAIDGDVLLASNDRGTGAGHYIALPTRSRTGDGSNVKVVPPPPGQSSNDLTIQAGGEATSWNNASPGGNLILRAGHSNVSHAGNCSSTWTKPDQNSVRIYAGMNVTTWAGGCDGQGNIELYAGRPSGLRMLVVGNTGNVGIGSGFNGDDPSKWPQHTLEVNGSVAGSGAYQQLSDARFKTNVATIEDALGIVESLRGVRFDWRQGEFPERELGSGRQAGFIAQEVATVLPEAVSQDANGVYSVAYASVVPVLVEAVKTQQRALDAKDDELRRLGAALAATERRQADTEARLERLEAALRRK